MVNHERLRTEAEATLASPSRLVALPEGVNSILYVLDWESKNGVQLPTKLARSRRVSDLILISLCLYPTVRAEDEPHDIKLGDVKQSLVGSHDRGITKSLVMREVGFLIDERWVSANPPPTHPSSAIMNDGTLLSLHPRLEVNEAELVLLKTIPLLSQEEIRQAS